MRLVPLMMLAAVLAVSGPAQAFDCANAQTDAEKLICSDDKLKAADNKLGEHWTSAKQDFSKQAFKALRESQRAWLKQRDEKCADGDDARRVQCLTELTKFRIEEILVAHRSGPGADGKIMPMTLNSDGGRRGYKVELSAFRFEEPKTGLQKAFNGEVAKLIKSAPVLDWSDFDTPTQLDYQQFMDLSYAAPHLVSARVSISRYDGGAHPNHFAQVINVSAKKGVLKFSDLFKKKQVTKLANRCFNALKREGGEVMSAEERRKAMFEPNPKTMHESVGNLALWAFSEQGATVLFSPYAIGPYAAGSFVCDLPLKALKKASRNPKLLPH